MQDFSEDKSNSPQLSAFLSASFVMESDDALSPLASKYGLNYITPPPFKSYSCSTSPESLEVKRPRIGGLFCGDRADYCTRNDGNVIELLRNEIECLNNLVSLVEQDHFELESYIRSLGEPHSCTTAHSF